MNNNFERIHTNEAINERGEVFTPLTLVNQILDKLEETNSDIFKDLTKTFLDNSCGNGNFLIEVLNRKMKYGISQIDALKTIYGVDIDEINMKECRERLSLGRSDKEIFDILSHNIICADTLDKNHQGWKEIGYMWSGKRIVEITDFF